MWRPALTEGGLRDPSFPTLHNLDPRVFESAKGVRQLAQLDQVSLAAWDLAAALFERAVAHLPADSLVLVCASNLAQCSTTWNDPGSIIQGATLGVVFAIGDNPDAQIHPGWTTIYVPLPEDHLRLLAGLRAVALTHGRSDVDVVLLNGTGFKPECVSLVPEVRKASIGYASIIDQMVPVYFGCFFSFGTALAPDRDMIRSSFGEYGNVYGWDESIAYVRSPVVWVSHKHPYGNCLRPGVSFENVTLLENWGEGAFNAWHYPSFSAAEMGELVRGVYRSATVTPEPTIQAPWSTVDGARAQRNEETSRLNIPRLQWGTDIVKYPRAGGRWLRVCNRRIGDPDWRGVDLPGAIWRSRDRAWGLRSRLAPTLTQGISPEVWDHIIRDQLDEDLDLFKIYDDAARRIGAWEATADDGIICIAAVPTRRMAELFKDAYRDLVKTWVFLSELEDEQTTSSECWVTLPTHYGVGFNFQLARLLPGVYSRHERIYTVANDLETDQIPRRARLDTGLLALRYEDVAFPAMDINSPCPFQDVVFRGDAFAERGNSLFRTLCTFGWVYGVDEVWCAIGDYPTIACRPTYGGASHPHKRNPMPSRLWRLVRGNLREVVAQGGRFRDIGDGTPVVKKGKWWDIRHVMSQWPEPSGFYEMTREDYLSWGLNMMNLAAESGGRFAVWFTFGTHGDRIPTTAAARESHRQTGVATAVVHLLTPEEGLANLALCEQGKAYNFLGDLVTAAADVMKARCWAVVPDYLWTKPSQLAYSLRAHEHDARNPRGGMPRLVDWIVQIIYWKDRARVRIGAYKGLTWFPRSADGTTFFKHKPVDPERPERKVVVLGSSTVPVPEEYADWPVLPPGDHIDLAKDVTVAVTNGSVGTVTTLKSGCGVNRIITYSDAIDRQWRTPQNAARRVTGNEPAEKYRWVYGHFSLSATLSPYYVTRHPIDTVRFLWWRINFRQLGSRLWLVLFTLYSMRYAHILPSIESTLIGALRLTPSGWVARSLLLLLGPRLLRAYADYCDKSYLSLLWATTKGLATGLFHPASSLFVSAGTHPVKATVYAALLAKIPLPFEILEGWTFKKRLAPDTVTGVWLFFTPVYVFGVPLGLHAGYYDARTSEVLEGAATKPGANALGSPFAFRRTKVSAVTPWFAIKSALTSGDLTLTNDVPAPYSAIWNCQIMLASLYLSHGKGLLALELIALVFFSAYAGIALLITTACCMFLASGAVVATAAAGPIDKAFPQWRLKERIQGIRRAFDGALTWFGAEAAPNTELRDAAACIAADALKSGLPETTVFEAIADATVAAAYSIETDRAPSEEICMALFAANRGPSDSTPSQFALVISRAVHAASAHTAKVGISPAILEGVAAVVGNVIDTCENALAEALAFTAYLADWLNAIGANVPVNALTDAMKRAVDNSAASRDDRKKNVWAILGKKNIESLRRADWLALALRRSSITVPRDDAISYIIDQLNLAHPNGAKLNTDDVYRVPSYLPQRPRASAQEYSYPSLLHSVDTQIDSTQTDRIAEYLTLGGAVGLDGMWTATDDMREAVTSRYFIEPYTCPEYVEDLVDDVVDTLYSANPEAFDAPAIVLPEVVRTKLNMKGRTGVPFINKVRHRKQLAETGWMEAIIQATYRILDTGEYPPDVYTEFAKMMTLDAEKMVNKGPRTIMATCMLTTFVNGVFELERRTRPIWESAHTGLGAPLTADYLGRAFEYVSQRRQTFGADVTAFDANVPPVIFEILSRLGELGAQKSDFPEVGQALRHKYTRLQNSLIVDLPTGKVWPKNRGGATGQTATSWDNTWAMRAVMVVVWSLATGKPAQEFYDHNSVHNTGDDNIWGTDDDIPPETFSRIARDALGLEIRIESVGDLGGLSYLSKNAVAGSVYEAEILRVRDSVPTFTAIHDRARLLTRRGAIVSRFSGQPFRAYKRSLVERGVGQALLTWHQRDLYNRFAHEWMADLRAYIGARSHGVVFDVTRDVGGDIETVTPRFSKNANATPEMERRLKEATRGALKWPSYQRVLDAAYTERQAPRPVSPYAMAAQKPSLDTVIREWVITTRLTLHRYIPEALVKLSPSPQAAPFTRIFHVWGYPVEKYVWRKCVETNPGTNLSEFAAAVRLSPYSTATATSHFWWFLEIPGMREAVMAAPMSLLYGRMVLATCLYVATTEFIQRLRRGPLGLLVEAFEIYTRDAPRWFSVLNTLYWLETCTSSTAISGLMPRDPYATHKQVAVMGSLFAPDLLVRAIGRLHTSGLMAKVSELIARFRTWRIASAIDDATKAPHANRWAEASGELLATAQSAISRGVIVSAETSTGKSTELVQQLSTRVEGRVWVAVHTRVLRDSYSNPWMDAHDVVRLSKGVSDTCAKVAVATYGHLLARQASGVGPREGDIVILDEFHLRMPVQAIAYYTLRTVCPMLLVSATPDDLYCPDADYRKIPIPREHALAVPRRLDLDPMAMFLELQHTEPEAAKRVLFICATRREVAQLVEALSTMGEMAHPLTAVARTIPPEGHIVATSVADTGVNIMPPPTALVDSGEVIVSDQGALARTPTDAALDMQRTGRVGRLGDGVAYKHTRAGTGTKPTPYPTHTEVCRAGEVRSLMVKALNITDRLTPMYLHGLLESKVDPFMSFDNDILGNQDRDTYVALSAWWLLANQALDIRDADAEYDKIVVGGWTDETEGIADVLSMKYRSTWLVARRIIAPLIARRPYIILYDGKPVHALRVAFRKGDTVWV
jgi:hypothetical protein